jgi:BirA family biotin operon repressor/biotin-[acetyl-CoA-carboxylase] ligase
MLMSFLLRPNRVNAPLMPLLAGVAACEALAHLCGQEPTAGPAGLKWPNDVLAPSLGERKLAGILAESSTPVAAAAAAKSATEHMIVVVGTGMNLRWGTPPPEEIQVQSATVEELVSGPVERDEVVALYLRHVDLWLGRLEAEGAAALLNRYRAHCLTLGREVSFTTSTAEYSGVAADVSDRGTLLLDTADGRVELHSGDAHHRR